MRYGEAGQSHLLPFLGAAALFAALTIMAHSVVLGLAAVIAGPVPAAQTALSRSRRAVSGAAQEEAASVAEAAPESTGTAASQPEAAAPTGGIESYLVELLGDDARPEGAGAVIEKNYPQGSGEKYVLRRGQHQEQHPTDSGGHRGRDTGPTALWRRKGQP